MKIPKVKICGITNIDDARAAVKYGADAVGFVFFKKSPRYIESIKAKNIISKLPPFVEKVGLFVQCSADFINKTMRECGLTLAQIHFEADENFFNVLECNYVRVVRAKEERDLKLYEKEYRFVDAFVEEFGGMGKKLPKEWFENHDNSKIILAGGLDSQNVKDLKKLGFYGFDVSSSVESEKGIKDHGKIKEFIDAVKN